MPYVLTGAVNAVIEQQVNPQLAAVLKAGDYRTLIDNSTVDRLVKEGFFQKLFGRRIRAEEERKAKLAFR